ncbi:MAG: hypothetical protein IT370_06975 [Deltaproteobacteria bacterium]|nr:hypothetical protein [Deltaproteobacteria bacterium]
MASGSDEGSGGPGRGRQPDMDDLPDPGEKPDSWAPWPGKRTITEGMRSPPRVAPTPASPPAAEPPAAPTTPPQILADLRSQLKTDLS